MPRFQGEMAVCQIGKLCRKCLLQYSQFDTERMAKNEADAAAGEAQPRQQPSWVQRGGNEKVGAKAVAQGVRHHPCGMKERLRLFLLHSYSDSTVFAPPVLHQAAPDSPPYVPLPASARIGFPWWKWNKNKRCQLFIPHGRSRSPLSISLARTLTFPPHFLLVLYRYRFRLCLKQHRFMWFRYSTFFSIFRALKIVMYIFFQSQK